MAQSAPPTTPSAQPGEVRKGFSSYMLVSAITLVGLVIAFVREMTLAAFVGPSKGLDVFLAAQQVPMQIGRNLGDAANACLVPAYIGVEKHDETQTDRFFLRWLAFGMLFALVTTGIVFALTVLNPTLLLPRLDAASRATLTFLFVLTLPFIGLLFVLSSVKSRLDLQRHVVPGSLIFVLMNIGVVISAFVMHSLGGAIYFLAYGNLCGGMIALAVLAYSFRRAGNRLSLARGEEADQPLPIRSFLLALGNSLLSSFAVWIDVYFCLSLGDRALSYLNFALLVINIPSLCLTPLAATLVYPRLSALIADGDRERLATFVEAVYRWVLLVGVLLLVPFTILAREVATFLFNGVKVLPADQQAIATIIVGMAAMPLISLLYFLYRLVLSGSLKQGAIIQYQVVGIVAKLGVCRLLIGHLGMGGIVAGHLAYATTMWLGYTYAASRLAGLHIPIVRLLRGWLPKVALAVSMVVPAWLVHASAGVVTSRWGAASVLSLASLGMVLSLLAAQVAVRDEELAMTVRQASQIVRRAKFPFVARQS